MQCPIHKNSDSVQKLKRTNWYFCSKCAFTFEKVKMKKKDVCNISDELHIEPVDSSFYNQKLTNPDLQRESDVMREMRC